MKKLLFISFIAFTSITIAQDALFDRWSVSYGMGGHLWTKPASSTKANLQNFQVSHHDINGRYMFNNRLGIMLDAGYDFFDFARLGKQNTHFLRFTIQGVVNAGDIIKLNTISKRLGLLVHGGMGYSAMWQKFPTNKTDQMINFVAGITPQIRIAKSWSLKADASVVANYKQGYTFDFLNKLSTRNTLNYTGVFFNLSLGVTYHIGKVKNHADWTPTNYGGGDAQKRIASLEERVRLLELHLKDDDNDGVINKRDLDPKSEEGIVVNSLGQAVKQPVDTDGDGLLDEVDECPTEPGRIMGCPDRDRDGVADKDDACPDEYGKPENNGCPLAKETMEVIRKISESTYFDTDKTTLKSESFTGLDNFASILKANPDVSVIIEGHTDNVGGTEYNKTLSKGRADSVKEYLISKGIDPGKIRTEGFGDTKPIAPNDTEEGKTQNRRVEIITFISEEVEINK